METSLSSLPIRINGFLLAIDNRPMESVLAMAMSIRDPVQPQNVRFVVCKKSLSIWLAIKVSSAKLVLERQVLERLRTRIIAN